MSNFSFLIIGTNKISDSFAEAARAVGVDLLAVYSRKSDTGRAFAEKHGIKRVYSNLSEALFDSEIDAVYVASPTFLHKEHSIMALRAGKHVLCEKSIASSASEYEEMLAAAKENKRVLLEAMRPAFDPALPLILKGLSSIGKIRRANLEFCKYSTRYDNFKRGIVENAFNPQIKNSALSDIGVYPLWLSVELFGEPREIKSEKIFLENGFLAMGASTLTYGDFFVNVTYSKITESTAPSFIEGECGAVFIDKVSEPKKLWIVMNDGQKIPIDYTPCENNMRYEISEFVRICTSGEDFSRRAKVSLSVMRVADMIHSHV